MSEEALNPDEPQAGPDAEPEEAGEAATAAAVEEPEDAPSADSPAASLRAQLERSFARVSADCAKVLGKDVEITIRQVADAAPESVAELAEGAALTSLARVKAEEELALALFASEEAALAVARAALGDDEVSDLDENAVSAFGEFARQVWGSIEGAWQEEGAADILIEVSPPERMEGPPEGFEEGEVSLVSAVAEIEGAGEVELSFLFPAAVAGLFQDAADGAPVQAGSTAFPPEIKRILRIKVPLVVEIAGRRSRVGAVVTFRPGSVIEFNKKSDDLLELYAGHAHIGRGEAVKVGESFGIRVLEIDSVRDRVKNLGH